PAAQVWGTDISALGLGCARDNARRLGVGNVRFRQGDLFGALPRELAGGVDVIVGNIPYVLPEEIGMMPAEIVEYEPLDTLTDGSADGLDLLRRVAGEAPEWLASRGWLMLQVNEESGEEVAGLLDGFGYRTEVHGADDSWDVIVEARR
ncbi:MAG TPA: putative protein N(5)-glutamine methyltransferase, partial [Acidimicrobiia bacterium]|nr:putative protein N(5)-glutamine methyltransferase [Acidimicrobiia bacterium]